MRGGVHVTLHCDEKEREKKKKQPNKKKVVFFFLSSNGKRRNVRPRTFICIALSFKEVAVLVVQDTVAFHRFGL